MAGPTDQLRESIIGLLESGNFSDLTIKAGTCTWAVHKAIICSQSDFFLKACTGRFQEATSNTICLDGDDNDAVDAMINFFYRRTYCEPTDTSDDEVASGVLHIAVFAIADKYDIADLMALSVDKFKPYAQGEWRETSFSKYVSRIYTDGPDKSPLKPIMLGVAANHFEELYGVSANQHKRFHDAADELPQFVRQMLFVVAAKQRVTAAAMAASACNHKSYACPACETVQILEEIKRTDTHRIHCFKCEVRFGCRGWSLR
ncbi:hypothetical protein LTS10_009817 [Elasticomyces elasticus]|nr:hypothetical protein LTS10_009817 [Elasticomyces elasticus]